MDGPGERVAPPFVERAGVRKRSVARADGEGSDEGIVVYKDAMVFVER